MSDPISAVVILAPGHFHGIAAVRPQGLDPVSGVMDSDLETPVTDRRSRQNLRENAIFLRRRDRPSVRQRNDMY